MKYLSHSLDETRQIAADFLKQLSAHTHTHTYTHTNTNTPVSSPHATVVGLSGDLGSGKTTFTQALGKILGVREVMTSPTFVLEKRYSLFPDSKFQILYSNLIHIDAYRLESGRELLSLNFTDMVADPQNLILIEWPERVADILPSDMLKINFKFVSESEREISF